MFKNTLKNPADPDYGGNQDMPRKVSSRIDKKGSVRIFLLKGSEEMENLKLILSGALICLLVTAEVYAAVPSPSPAPGVQVINMQAKATVPKMTPDLNFSIWKLTQVGQDPAEGIQVPTASLDFGELVISSKKDRWYSANVFCVMLYANSYGQRYEIKNSCPGLAGIGTSDTGKLPDASFQFAPTYDPNDLSQGSREPQGPIPTGAALGNAGAAVGENKLIYGSEAAGTSHVVRVYYAIPAEGGEPIPLNQAAGTYKGTVSITITAL